MPAVSTASRQLLELGIQTWTLRNIDFDQVAAFAKKHKIKKL